MAALLITYNLRSPGQDYSDLHESIKHLGAAWWHYLESTWIVDTTLTPQAAWERLDPVFDSNDRVLIIDVTRAPRQGWLPRDAWGWLSDHKL